MWQWRVEVDGEIRRSRTFFYTLDDCVKHAQHNGFKGQLSASDSYGQTSYRRESTDDEGNPAPIRAIDAALQAHGDILGGFA